jgi:hypothetical protein
MHYAARLFSGTVIGLSNASENKLAQCIAEAYAAAHPAGAEERAQSQAERDFTDAINIISSLEKERDSLTTALAEAKELLREIRDNEVNAIDEADKFLRDHVPSELSKAKARCAELDKELEGAIGFGDEEEQRCKNFSIALHGAERRAALAEAQRDKMKAALERLMLPIEERVKEWAENRYGVAAFSASRMQALSDALQMTRAALSTQPAEEKP